MKTRKSITLKIPLPPNGGAIENSVGFKRFLAEAATKLLSQSCNEVWVRDKYVLFLKAEERRRRQAFQNRVAELKAGKPAASVATPASSSAPTVNVPPGSGQPVVDSSKKAPVATTGKDGNGHA